MPKKEIKWINDTYFGRNYNYGYVKEINRIIIAEPTNNVMHVTLKVKNFTTAKQIVSLLEK